MKSMMGLAFVVSRPAFTEDPRTLQIRTKSSEQAVVSYIMHDIDYCVIHDSTFAAGCCTARRRIYVQKETGSANYALT